MKHKILALIVAALLVTWAAVPAWAEEEGKTIVIQSAEEFLAFADNCALDAWSQDKAVVLQADISLEGTEFAGIATFAGTLDGGGHTITGLNLRDNTAPAGLFRNLQPTAVVKNLTVSGRVAPGGDGESVGGLVGVNHGMVENCVFTGEVLGQENTGGIAGVNYGTLRRCRTSGTVTGEDRTGGVAGYNDGAIDNCENAMQVNVDSVDPTIDPGDVNLDFSMDLSRLSSLDTTDAPADTGGIAGYSSGTVTDCVNTGPVGYPHIGYNLGGIVGRNCGLINGCCNTGHVQGRKDVGGIVGQMEPDIATILSPDYLQTLSQQFESLGNLVSAAGSHAAGAGNEVQSCVQAIAAYQSSARAALDSIASGLANAPEAGFGSAADAVQSLGSAIQGMVNATGNLRSAITGSVEDMSGDVDAISGQIGSISRTFALATEDAKEDTVTDISQAELSQISEGRAVNCVNDGPVEADVNVGGVTGIMGLEYEIDPEDDAPDGSLTQRRRYALKAIVQDCVNEGAVTGKRSYVGGICGRMELGTIASSQGYGTICSESGDYVGGIAGLAGGTVQDCFAKCTLSGEDYVGGIVGCGIEEDYSGDSSLVTGCYSMVQITQYQQYIGGISGGDAGAFTGNFFVSDTLEGVNGVSYYALAEPISYETLAVLPQLPDPLRQFTVSFVADEVVLKTASFAYGASFGADAYPQIPEKEGYYARWSLNELTDLRFDTVVQAEYIPYITALSADGDRPEEKPMLFVQGQFQEGDSLTVAPGTTAFPEGESGTLLEHWYVSIPADGLQSHGLRYLPTQDDVEIYLLKNGSWSRVSTQTAGSYLAFETEGPEVELAITQASSGGWAWMLLAAGAFVVLALVAWLFFKRRKTPRAAQPAGQATPSPRQKKRKRLCLVLAIVLVLAACAAGAAWLWFPRTQVGQSLQAYEVLRAYAQQPRQEMTLTVKAELGDRNADFTAEIVRITQGDTPVSVVSEGGRKLYFADGVVLLEDGTAYRPNGVAPDYSGLLEQVMALPELAEVEVVDGACSVTVQGEPATAMLKLLLPSAGTLLPQANQLRVDVITEGENLQQLHFTGAGNLTDSVKTPFSLSATVDVSPVSEGQELPEPVAKAVASGEYQAQELYSDDLVALIEAWTDLRSRSALIIEGALEANCGPLSVQEPFVVYQWKLEDGRIWGAEAQGRMLYFSESGVCDGEGKTVPAAEIRGLDAGKVAPVVYRSFKDGTFQCQQEAQTRVYTVALDREGMEQIAGAFLPEAEEWGVSLQEGSVQLVVRGQQAESLQIFCGGSGKVLAADVAFQLSAELRLKDDVPAAALPEAVLDALYK